MKMKYNCSSDHFFPAKLSCQPNTWFSLSIATILFFGLSIFAGPSLAQGPLDWVADELLVTLRSGVGQERARDIFQRHGAAVIDEIPQIKTHLIRVPTHALEKVQLALSRRPEVEFVEKNFRFAPDFTPNDTYYLNQWHLPQIQSPPAWDIVPGAADVIIAILDSGVDAAHNDLGGKLVAGYNFYDGNTDTRDVYGHGTRVAGAAAAAGNNSIGVAGVAWQARIMPIRVTGTDGWAYTSTISKGLTWAVDNGARVMNLSFAGITGSSTIRSTAQYVADRGGVVVAAAGNCGCLDSAPEAIYIVSVSATDSHDDLAYFSSRGEYVDVSAPGSGIWTTSRGGGYASVSGTSFASPVTAGVAALIISANPDLAPLEIMEILENTSDDLGPAGYDTSFGFGRVNAYEAVLAAGGFEPQPDTDTTPPGASITSPADGAAVSGTIAVSIQETDNVGTVAVELYLDGGLYATDTSVPYAFAWDTGQAENGVHTLQAVARDAAGNSGYSDIVTVAVNNTTADLTPPEVLITSPADSAFVSGTITVSVSASDNVGVTLVELYVDGGFQATDSTAPFSFEMDTTGMGDGSHTLQVRAYDAAGNAAASASVSVAVENTAADTSSPTVTIVSPADGDTVSKLVKISVKAVDDIQVIQLDLLIDGALERATTCAASVCEVQIPWNTRQVAPGRHTFEAVATDAAGNSARCTPVVVDVK